MSLQLLKRGPCLILASEFDPFLIALHNHSSVWLDLQKARNALQLIREGVTSNMTAKSSWGLCRVRLELRMTPERVTNLQSTSTILFIDKFIIADGS